MGIKRFGLRMRDYAVRDTLGSTNAPAKDSVAIIDGPGLAHHVFYQLCDERQRNITYQACVDAAIAWLKELRSIGFEIEAIFFDGALPESKKDVRIGRLQSYSDRLVVYKQSLGNAPPTLSGQTRKSLSPPPFLVFAIVEELLRHPDFCDVTYLVQGEADPYCVAAAQAFRGDSPVTILSDDADLLVYQLGKHTGVVAFRDLYISHTASTIVWTAERYSPSEVVKRSPIPIKDMIKPAYFMEKDPYLSFENACRMLKSKDPCKEPDFAAFEKTFQTTEEVTQWDKIKSAPTEEKSSNVLDSRISECIHRLESSARGEESGGLRMYLPFILDDPSKKTAWSVGGGLRTLAYSALLQLGGMDLGVQEYRRSGIRIVSTPVEPLSEDGIVDQAKQLTAHIQQVLAWAVETYQLPQDDAWRCIVLQHVLSNLQADGYLLPSLEDLLSVLSQDEEPKWHLIHLSGQYQAAFYSFRMIKQIISYMERHSDGTAGFKDLAQLMESLPRISTFFGNSDLDKQAWRAIVGDVLSTLTEKDDDEEQRPRKKAKKSKKKGKPLSAGLQKNPFAMLADD